MSDFFRNEENSDKAAENVDNGINKILSDNGIDIGRIYANATGFSLVAAARAAIKGGAIVDSAAIGGGAGAALWVGVSLLEDTYTKVHAERLAREAAEGNNEKHLGVLPSPTFPNRIEPPLNNEKTRH
jgi:hypothetical protein